MPTSWIQDLAVWLQKWLPPEAARVAIAAGIIVLGFVLAQGLRFVLTRAFGRASAWLIHFTRQTSKRAGLLASFEVASDTHAVALTISGRIVFWLVFSLFLAAAASVLGFSTVSGWLAGLAQFLPSVLAAAAIVLLGVLSGMLVRVAVTAAAGSSALAHARSLGRAAQVAVIVMATVVAIEELGIQVTFVIVIAAIVLAATLGGAALAFGLGAKASVSNLLACHYLSKWYRVGQIIRIGEYEGRIAQILPSAVILDTQAGKIYVPAREFAAVMSVLISEEASS